MYIFHKYLKRKNFILYTDLKPLEKMDHLHTKTMNRLQAALLEHNFIIQCKKGNIMLADYLLRLPSSHHKFIAALDPFQTNLQDLQKLDWPLQLMN